MADESLMADLVYTMTYTSYMFLRSPGDLAFSPVDTTSNPGVSAVLKPENYVMLLAWLDLKGTVLRRKEKSSPIRQKN